MSNSVTKKRLTTTKSLSEIQSFILEMKAPTSQAIDQGLRTPRTQQHFQKTSQQLSLLNSDFSKCEYTYGWYSASILRNK
jgi:hypothetical protein